MGKTWMSRSLENGSSLRGPSHMLAPMRVYDRLYIFNQSINQSINQSTNWIFISYLLLDELHLDISSYITIIKVYTELSNIWIMITIIWLISIIKLRVCKIGRFGHIVRMNDIKWSLIKLSFSQCIDTSI